MNFFLFYLFNLPKYIHNKYLFNKTSNVHLKILNKTNFKEIPIISEFQYKTTKIKNTIMENYHFQNNNFRKVTVSYFKSDDQQIFRSEWCPSYDYDCPILNIYLINYGKSESFFFMHLERIYEDNIYKKKYIDPFLKIKVNNSFLKYFNESLLYCKLNNNEIEKLIPVILDKYFDIYFAYFIKKPVNRYFIEQKHREYSIIKKNKELKYKIKKYFNNDWYYRFIIEMNK